tara:strand:- start:7609 stop:10041 length:2433 start_codon:yes stop_codon:yes gene_type:complete
MSKKIFNNLNVLDLGIGPVGGLASMILADHGANVLAVEPPGGDPFRKMESSSIWMRNKESIELDFTNQKDKKELQALLSNTDIVIIARSPKEQKKLGLTYSELTQYKKDLVYCSINGFGNKGKYKNYPGYDATISAISGRMQTLSSIVNREGPSYSIVPVASHAAAFNACTGIAAALIKKELTGAGQMVEISLLRSLMLYDFHELFLEQLAKKNNKLYGPNGEFGTIDRNPALSYQPFLTKDGLWIQTGNLVERLFLAFAKEMKLNEEDIKKSNQSFHHQEFQKIKENLRKQIIDTGKKHTARYWTKKFNKNGNIANEVYLSTQKALSQKDIIANNNVIEINTANHGSFKQVGFIANFSGISQSIYKNPPEINQHKKNTLKKFKSKTSIQQKKKNTTSLPLSDITIVEIASVIAGPLASSILSDLGARVIKIEPITGDPFRSYRDEIPITKVNAGKESIAIDLKSSKGKKIMHQLIKNADVLVHNNRPGVAERLDFGYERIKKINKKIVYAWINAYGSKGPSLSKPGAHPIAGAVLGGALRQAGIEIHNNKLDYEKLSTKKIIDLARQIHAANEPSPDPNTSVVAAAAISMGIYRLIKDSTGSFIETNMLGANAYAQLHEFYNFKDRKLPEMLDKNLFGISPYKRLYRTKKNQKNQWVLLMIQNKNEWSLFCRLAKKLSPINKLSSKQYGKSDNTVVKNVESFFSKFAAQKLEKYFIKNGINCVVADGEKFGPFLMNNTHSKANVLTASTKTKWGQIHRHAPVVTFSKSKTIIKKPMNLGEHTNKILRELGYKQEEIKALANSSIIIEGK